LNYPFCALIGQEKAVKAVELNLVCPAIGGLLLSGEKGTGKSTLLRGAADLCGEQSVVNLPLHSGEEGLFGSLKIEKALKEGLCDYEPGVLSRAHNQILYIDEVNLLLPSRLSMVTQIATTGFYHLEREGMSRIVPSRFTLFASMNPEEGELETSDLDRFGLFVSLEGEQDVAKRASIVRNRLAFDRDPRAFTALYRKERETRKEKIQKARNQLPQVGIGEEILHFAASLCREAGLEGNRGDLVLIHTARALAVLDGRDRVLREDIQEASAYVFPHRIKEKRQEEISPPDTPKEKEPHKPLPPPPEERQDESGQGGRGEERHFSAKGHFDFPLPQSGSKPSRISKKRREGKKNCRDRGNRGPTILIRQADGKSKNYAIAATIRAAAPYKKRRQSEGQRLVVKSEDLRIRVRRKKKERLIFFLVDASGSMGAAGRMAETKGAVLSLLRQSYVNRDRVAMMAFRRDRAEMLLHPTRSVEFAKKELEELPVGGATPLALALAKAHDYIKGQLSRDPSLEPHMVVLSDGRGNAKPGDNRAEEALGEKARAIGQENYPVMLIDTEKGWVRLGKAEELARSLGAAYFRLDDYRSDKVANTIENYIKNRG